MKNKLKKYAGGEEELVQWFTAGFVSRNFTLPGGLAGRGTFQSVRRLVSRTLRMHPLQYSCHMFYVKNISTV